MESRLSIERCRQLFGRGSDAELALAREQLYGLAEVVVRAFLSVQSSSTRGATGPLGRPSAWLSPEDAEDAEERAAIVEFEGGRERLEAERQALRSIVRPARNADERE